jgi:hypothetical protein
LYYQQKLHVFQNFVVLIGLSDVSVSPQWHWMINGYQVCQVWYLHSCSRTRASGHKSY